MSFRSLFIPDNKKFYLLFDAVAEHLQQMSLLFLEAVRNNDAIENYIAQLDELEKANDLVTHKLFIELGKNFITPFDREDIHYLASGLDDIADDMLGVIKQMRSHKIDTPGVVTIAVAEQNKQAIHMLSDVLHKLRNMRSLNTMNIKCDEIKSLLASGSNEIDQAAHVLFQGQNDTLYIIRFMDHYEKLQQLLDRISNAVNVIESIIIKYG